MWNGVEMCHTEDKILLNATSMVSVSDTRYAIL